MGYRNKKPYEKMTKPELIKEVKMEAENHMKMDRLADRKANKIDDLTRQLNEYKDCIWRLEQQLARALGYIDRVKDCETVKGFSPRKPKETETRPYGPGIRDYDNNYGIPF